MNDHHSSSSTDEHRDTLLLEKSVRFFEELPREQPTQDPAGVVEYTLPIYATWVLIHGYRVNHFTALVDNIKDVHTEMMLGITAAGDGTPRIAVKDTIEGKPGSKLRQTTTREAMIPVQVKVEQLEQEGG